VNSILITAAISIILGLVFTPVLIPFLRRLKFGQSIREEGPSWHRVKSGTPTMGGIAIIAAAILAPLAVMLIKGTLRYDLLLLLLTALLYGFVGFVDDFIKVVKKRNLGLSARSKFLSQLLVAICSTLSLNYLGYLNGELLIPFMSAPVDIGLWIVPLTVLVQLSVVNSVNLTDGLDGLAASVTLIVSLFFTICALAFSQMSAGMCMAAVGGACLAFLVFNAHPAKVFMGDTGSLFLGGAVAVCASVLQMPLILIIAGGIYLIETLSVILQVASFKLTGKRIFKMSPLHHHFEMCGYSEVKIVLLFSLTTLILCIIGYVCIMKLF